MTKRLSKSLILLSAIGILSSCGIKIPASSNSDASVSSNESGTSASSSQTSEGTSSTNPSSSTGTASSESDPSSSSSSSQESSSSSSSDRLFKLVTSASDLITGASYAIASAASGSAFALKAAVKSTYYLDAVAISIASSQFSYVDGLGVFSLGEGTAAGTYSFFDSGTTGHGYLRGYVSGTHYNVAFAEAAGEETNWSVSVDSTGAAQLSTNAGVYLEYYSKFSEFAGYSKPSAVYLFQEVGSAHPVSVSGVSLDHSTLDLKVGYSAAIKATIAPANATNKKVSYTSGNAAVATIDSTGLVHGVGEGVTSVTAVSDDGGFKADCTVNVSPAASGETGYHRADDPQFKLLDANHSMGYYPLNSIGSQKLLVVPVQCKDGPAWTDAMKTRLNKAIFGQSGDTYWESVSSFYYKSSYGKITIGGELTDPLVLAYTQSQVDAKGSSAPDDLVIPAFYAKADASLLKSYDQDGDGRVDATLFVYSNDYSTDDGSAFWAWVWYPDFGTSQAKPQISTYFWVSYTFMNDSGDAYIDAHTFIHECGHILGLDDYYNYDGEYDAAGDKEMQSYNIGDQGMFSKLELGWVNPYVLDASHADSVVVPLRSSALYPDALLINDSWNGSPNDEYILIEYYTPEGNNGKDSQTQYVNRDRMYTNSGLRIYHVDARLAKLSADASGNAVFHGYSDTIANDGYIYFTGASNSTSWAYLNSPDNANFRLLNLMQADVTSGSDAKALKNGGSASVTGTLFTQGKTWSAMSGIFYNGANTFNDKSKIGYNITLSSVNEGVASVTVTRI